MLEALQATRRLPDTWLRSTPPPERSISISPHLWGPAGEYLEYTGFTKVQTHGAFDGERGFCHLVEVFSLVHRVCGLPHGPALAGNM